MVLCLVHSSRYYYLVEVPLLQYYVLLGRCPHYFRHGRGTHHGRVSTIRKEGEIKIIQFEQQVVELLGLL